MSTPFSLDLSDEGIERLLAGDGQAAEALHAADLLEAPTPLARPDDAAVVPLTFKPAIIVLIGGTAIEVGHELLRRRAQFIVEAGDTPAVRQQNGAIAPPDAIHFVSMLPKTRSGKIMRRVIRAVYQGDNIGDLSTIEDDATVDMVREAVDLLKGDL